MTKYSWYKLAKCVPMFSLQSLDTRPTSHIKLNHINNWSNQVTRHTGPTSLQAL